MGMELMAVVTPYQTWNFSCKSLLRKTISDRNFVILPRCGHYACLNNESSATALDAGIKHAKNVKARKRLFCFDAKKTSSCLRHSTPGMIFRLDALAWSVIATATWLGGWVAGCHTPVLYQNR